MAKSNHTQTTPIDQGITHNPTFKSTCLPLCKIRGISEVFDSILADDEKEVGR